MNVITFLMLFFYAPLAIADQFYMRPSNRVDYRPSKPPQPLPPFIQPALPARRSRVRSSAGAPATAPAPPAAMGAAAAADAAAAGRRQSVARQRARQRRQGLSSSSRPVSQLTLCAFSINERLSISRRYSTQPLPPRASRSQPPPSRPFLRFSNTIRNNECSNY